MIRQVKRPDILDGKGKGIFQLLSYSGIFGSQNHPKPLPNKETGKSSQCNHVCN